MVDLYVRAIAVPTLHAIVNVTTLVAVVHFKTPVYDAPVDCPFVIPPNVDDTCVTVHPPVTGKVNVNVAPVPDVHVSTLTSYVRI